MPDPSLEKPKLNLKKMGFKKSVIHLWTYYKWWVIIPVIVIAIIISFVNSYLKATKKEYLSIACVNARYESNHIFDEYANESEMADATKSLADKEWISSVVERQRKLYLASVPQ